MPRRQESAPRDQSLPREEKLRRRADYRSCYERGRRRHGRLSVLYTVPNGLRHPRLGITASRKVGGAVVRTRTKRRIKEIYRRWSGRDKLPAVDLLVHVKPAGGRASFEELRSELNGHFRQVLRSGESTRQGASSAPC